MDTFLEPERGNLIIKVRSNMDIEEYQKFEESFGGSLYFRGGIDTNVPSASNNIKSAIVVGVPTGKLGEYVWVEFEDEEDREAFKQLLSYVKEYKVSDIQLSDLRKKNIADLNRLRYQKSLKSEGFGNDLRSLK